MRGFNRSTIRVHGSPNVPGYQVTCCKCGVVEKMSANSRSGTLAPELVAAKFRNIGWSIGTKEGRDVCPKCQSAAKKTKRETESNVVSLIQPGAAVVEPPREMSKEDKRLIFSKINDVYLDEKQGYSSGWSDKRVADDLGVPLAWVRSIREDNFGSEGANEDVGPIIEEAKKLLEAIAVEANIITERLQQAAEARAELIKRADHISGKIAKLEKVFLG